MILKEGEPIGYVGMLHPAIVQAMNLKGSIAVFELKMAAVSHKNITIFKPLSKFPVIKRDLAFLVDKSLPAQAIKNKIVQSANNLLHKVEIFDIYHGEGIDTNKKSVALGLTFQHEERTLVDEEINTQMNNVISQLEKELDAKLR